MTRNIWIRRYKLEKALSVNEIYHKVHDDGSYDSIFIKYYSYSNDYEVIYRFNKKISNDVRILKKYKNIITKKYRMSNLNDIYEKFNLHNKDIHFINLINDILDDSKHLA